MIINKLLMNICASPLIHGHYGLYLLNCKLICSFGGLGVRYILKKVKLTFKKVRFTFSKVSFTFLQRYRSKGMTDYHFYQQINIPSLKGVTKWLEALLFTIQSINYQLITIRNEEVKHFFRLSSFGSTFYHPSQTAK